LSVEGTPTFVNNQCTLTLNALSASQSATVQVKITLGDYSATCNIEVTQHIDINLSSDPTSFEQGKKD